MDISTLPPSPIVVSYEDIQARIIGFEHLTLKDITDAEIDQLIQKDPEETDKEVHENMDDEAIHLPEVI